MTRKILISITLVLGLLALITIINLARTGNIELSASTAEATTPIASTSTNSTAAAPTNETSATTPTDSVAPVAATAAAETTATKSIATGEQLRIERERLELQRQQVENLRARHAIQLQQLNVSFPNQISARTTQITNLSEALQTQRLAENDIRESTSAALQEQSTADRASREQLDLSVQQVEQNIQQIRELMSYPAPPGVVTATEQQTRINNLQNLLLEQTQQLTLLKEQRANLSNVMYQQTAAINAVSQQQRTELVQTQVETQNEIFSLRDEVVRLETASNQTRMSMMPLSQQISQAESEYQKQQQRIRELEAQQ